MTFLLISGLVLLLSLAIFGLTSIRKVYFANINNNILIRLTGTLIHSWQELTAQLVDKGVEEAKMRMN